MTDNVSTALPRTLTPSLFMFSIIYGGMVVLAGVLGNKQVALGGSLAVEAGIFSFLILVTLSSAVAEIHGQSTANKLVLWGFVPLVMSIAFTSLVLALPAASKMDPERLAAFEMVLGQSPRLMAAGIIAYGTSQFLNVTIFSKLRAIKGAGAVGLAVGGAIASALSQIVDTILFVTVAFYGVFPIGGLMGGQMIAKILLSIVVIPFVITGFVALGRHLDTKKVA
ncbi:queuosine precursor transporter [Sphingopyxis yananensis]|uniref:queuosine precursor transporter n=1 Tax=Sphingopyxis yananensis TaxID=2886687 RepID=UPI001D0F95BD|nr:queuosine precursor transporter [Sphingopyxis yananensis]MCC2601507.1 queuosine precursor transporter [Sphingopyxis yananensis]